MRRAAAFTMVVVTVVLLAAAAIAWYADDTLVDDREFATRLTSSLDDGDVRAVVGDQIVTGLTSSAVPDALIVRPLICRSSPRSRTRPCSVARCTACSPRATARWSGATRRSACTCRWGRARSSRGCGGSLRASPAASPPISASPSCGSTRRASS